MVLETVVVPGQLHLAPIEDTVLGHHGAQSLWWFGGTDQEGWGTNPPPTVTGGSQRQDINNHPSVTFK